MLRSGDQSYSELFKFILIWIFAIRECLKEGSNPGGLTYLLKEPPNQVDTEKLFNLSMLNQSKSIINSLFKKQM